MKFAIAELTFSPPLIDEAWMQTTQSLVGCIAVRNIQWLYSLVSVRGDRAICLFEASTPETVQDACREAGISFQRVYAVQQWIDQEPTSGQDNFWIVVETNFEPPITKSVYESEKQRAAGCFLELNIQYAWSVVTLDGTRSHCVFSAACAEDVRSLYRKLNAPFDRVWKAKFMPG